jgi:hypothetical protein
MNLQFCIMNRYGVTNTFIRESWYGIPQI